MSPLTRRTRFVRISMRAMPGSLSRVIGELRIGGEERVHRVFLAMEDREAVDVGDAGAGQVEGGDAVAGGEARIRFVREEGS